MNEKNNQPDRPKKLTQWQKRLSQSDSAYGALVVRMDEREKLYNGDRKLRKLVKGDKKAEQATHVRNIIFENIESQISSSIPQPKVTAYRKKDERLAQIIENMCRNELDRQPFERINDMAERTVPVQGGTGFLVEWDNSKRTHNTVGALKTSLIHPKQMAPQPGIYTSIQDMDWFIIKRPTTKAAIQREYGINVYAEQESEPQIRSTGSEDTSEDTLTQYIGYEINDRGGINRYSWVNDLELEDLENYQARRQPVCKKCGKVRPLPGQVISNNVQSSASIPVDTRSENANRAVAGRMMAGTLAQQEMEETGQALAGIEVSMGVEPEQTYNGGPCPWCGGNEWTDEEQEYERVLLPIETELGKRIPGEHLEMDEAGNPAMVPTLVPFYKPEVYPLVVQRSVSVYGQFWGNSDVDAIEDQQNTTNRIEKKIIDRLLKAGSRITLPNKASLKMDPEDGERWYLDNASDKSIIGLYEFKGNLQYEMAYLSQVYEEARQILGITNSFQGRPDSTATSGKAKEYSAAQAAGRLESKRILKNAAYADLFELFFKFQLAYADEPRTVSFKNVRGETEYEEFNRYDFLEQDESGEWYWNDQFLFSCDTSAPLAGNREAMWQETRQNLQSGAFGNPSETETLVLFWTKMELLHYPGAGETKKYLEEKLQREQAKAIQAQQMQILMAQAQGQGNMSGRSSAAPPGGAM